MRILIFVPKGYPRLGGSEILSGLMAQGYAGLGHQVTLLAPRNGRQARCEIVDGRRVRRFGSARPTVDRSYLFGYLIPYFFAFLCECLRHDIVLFMGCNYSVYCGARMASIMGRRVVIQQQTGGSEEGDVATFLRSPGGRRRMTKLPQWVDRFFPTTSEQRGELIQAGVPARKIEQIPNCIDMDRFKPIDLPRRERLRAQWGLSGKHVILAGGRMVKRKRIDMVIRVFQGIRQRDCQAVLCLVGDGPEREALQQQVSSMSLGDFVRFEGSVTNMPDYLGISDVYFHAASSEGLVLAIIEAMAMGIPVVAPRIGGVVDLIRSEEEGFLFDPDSHEEAADCLARALSGDHEQRVSRLRKRVEESYSLKSVAQKHQAVFSRLMSTGKIADRLS